MCAVTYSYSYIWNNIAVRMAFAINIVIIYVALCIEYAIKLQACNRLAS